VASLSDYTVKQMLDEVPSLLYSMDGEEPIILAGVHLSALDIEAVASLSPTGEVDGIILGYCVLRLISVKSLWSVFYQTKISTVKLRVLTAKPEENLEQLVRRIMKTGWGYAVVVDADDKPSNLVGLLNLAAFYQKSGVASRLAGMRVSDRASNPLFGVSEKVSVLSAIRTMLDQHARRLLVKESGVVVDDRGVIKWLLSPANMTKLRDSPREVLQTPLTSMPEIMHTPPYVEPGTDCATALYLITKSEARCVITSDRRQILTPWDLTVRLLVE
jgi:CBS domain-containing protein